MPASNLFTNDFTMNDQKDEGLFEYDLMIDPVTIELLGDNYDNLFNADHPINAVCLPLKDLFLLN
jgi:hypothetical protein